MLDVSVPFGYPVDIWKCIYLALEIAVGGETDNVHLICNICGWMKNKEKIQC